jgi:hypothetical protein
MRLVDLGEIALAQQIQKFEDVVLDLLVDGGVVVGLLMLDHPLVIFILSLKSFITSEHKFLPIPLAFYRLTNY